MVINEQKVIEVTVGDLEECIKASVEAYFKNDRGWGLVPYVQINDLKAHLYGNVTLALIGKESKRKREHPLPIACDTCYEMLNKSGMDELDEYSTGDVLQMLDLVGQHIPDHVCSDHDRCACSCTSN